MKKTRKPSYLMAKFKPKQPKQIQMWNLEYVCHHKSSGSSAKVRNLGSTQGKTATQFIDNTHVIAKYDPRARLYW